MKYICSVCFVTELHLRQTNKNLTMPNSKVRIISGSELLKVECKTLPQKYFLNHDANWCRSDMVLNEKLYFKDFLCLVDTDNKKITKSNCLFFHPPLHQNHHFHVHQQHYAPNIIISIINTIIISPITTAVDSALAITTISIITNIRVNVTIINITIIITTTTTTIYSITTINFAIKITTVRIIATISINTTNISNSRNIIAITSTIINIIKINFTLAMNSINIIKITPLLLPYHHYYHHHHHRHHRYHNPHQIYLHYYHHH